MSLRLQVHGLLFSIIVILLIASNVNAATVYVKKISSTVYYDSSASSCADVTSSDTSGDLEAAVAAAGANGTCTLCSNLEGGSELDSDSILNITQSGVTLDLNNYEIDIDYTTDYPIKLEADTITIKNGTLKSASSGTDLIYTSDTDDHVIEEIIFKGYYTQGVRIAPTTGCSGITVRKCVFQPENVMGGVGVYFRDNTSDIVISNNLFIDYGYYGIYVVDSDGVDPPSSIRIYNNTFYSVRYPITFYTANVDSSQATIKNNIFHSSVRGINNGGSNSPTLDYNCWYNNTEDIYGNGTKGAHAVNSDPLFKNAGGSSMTDYRLQDGSPCKDSGENLGSDYESTIYSTSVVLEWNSSNGTVTGYRIYWRATANDSWEQIWEGTETTARVAAVSGQFTCRAYNTEGESGNSNIVNYTHSTKWSAGQSLYGDGWEIGAFPIRSVVISNRTRSTYRVRGSR